MIKNIIKVLIGLQMVIVALIGYIPQLEYLIELTCVSNVLGGVLLITDGILGIIKKKVHLTFFYSNVVVSIDIVFIICMVSFLMGIYKFNFSGAFFFLHVINPLIFTICYILFVNEQNRKNKSIMNSTIMIVLYLIFDYIRYQFTGKFIYGFVNINEISIIKKIIACVVIYTFICLFSLILFTLNKFIHKKYQLQ